MKHTRLLRELQELKERLLGLPICNVVKETGNGTRRMRNSNEEIEAKTMDHKGKSNRIKVWAKTKSRTRSIVRRH
jgi:hypothetical protein